MKDKYIEERYPRYFVFGKHKNGDVDLADTRNDSLATVSLTDAETLIKERDAIVDALCAMAQAFDAAAPEAFDKFWYGR